MAKDDETETDRKSSRRERRERRDHRRQVDVDPRRRREQLPPHRTTCGL